MAVECRAIDPNQPRRYANLYVETSDGARLRISGVANYFTDLSDREDAERIAIENFNGGARDYEKWLSGGKPQPITKTYKLDETDVETVSLRVRSSGRAAETRVWIKPVGGEWHEVVNACSLRYELVAGKVGSILIEMLDI